MLGKEILSVRQDMMRYDNVKQKSLPISLSISIYCMYASLLLYVMSSRRKQMHKLYTITLIHSLPHSPTTTKLTQNLFLTTSTLTQSLNLTIYLPPLLPLTYHY